MENMEQEMYSKKEIEERKNGIYISDKGEYCVNTSDFVDNFLENYGLRVFEKGYLIYRENLWDKLDRRNLGKLIKNQIFKIEPKAYKRSVHTDIEHYIHHSIDEIDQLNIYPFKVNFSNGVFNYKTLEMEHYDEDNYFDYMFPYPLNLEKTIETPHFDKFISETFKDDQEMIKYMLYLIGYWISGTKTRQKFYILHGRGSNGKSVLIELVEKLIGKNFVITIPISKINDRFSLGNAFGKKIISSSENEDEGKAIGTQIIKGLTGNDRLSIERKFKDGKTVNLSIELIFSANNILKFKDLSDGFKRRIEVIPFENRVVNPDVYLSEKLEKELEGITQKVTKAFMRGIPKCKKIEDTTISYLKKSIIGNDNSDVHEFLDNNITESSEGRIVKSELYRRYCSRRLKPVSEESFWSTFRRWAEFNDIHIQEKRNVERFMTGVTYINKSDSEISKNENTLPLKDDNESQVEKDSWLHIGLPKNAFDDEDIV